MPKIHPDVKDSPPRFCHYVLSEAIILGTPLFRMVSGKRDTREYSQIPAGLIMASGPLIKCHCSLFSLSC